MWLLSSLPSNEDLSFVHLEEWQFSFCNTVLYLMCAWYTLMASYSIARDANPKHVNTRAATKQHTMYDSCGNLNASIYTNKPL
jgi:hypothetical protein